MFIYIFSSYVEINPNVNWVINHYPICNNCKSNIMQINLRAKLNILLRYCQIVQRTPKVLITVISSGGGESDRKITRYTSPIRRYELLLSFMLKYEIL